MLIMICTIGFISLVMCVWGIWFNLKYNKEEDEYDE